MAGAIPGIANNIEGSSAGETIAGRGKNDTLAGNGGDDTLKGCNGFDDLDGGEGDDTLSGGNGRDRLHGGEGNNTLNGGNGDDTFVIDGDLAGLSFDTIVDFDGDRQLRKMVFDDGVELVNVGGKSVRYEQNGDDVELYVDDQLMALFKGSEGLLLAEDVLAATRVMGAEPASLEVGGEPVASAFSGIRIIGAASGDQSGYSVASAGDVDGDGKDDVIIGAYGADPDGASYAGVSHLVYGAALAESEGVIDLADFTSAQGVLIKGIDASDYSGYSVSSAGDVNGDGKDDVIIGAYGADPDGASDAGESYLLFGDALASSDGTLDLATLTPDQGVLIKGIDPSDYSGYSVSSAGDVDNDGKDDVIIGAHRASPDGTAMAGESYLLFGDALASGDGTLDLATLIPDQGVLIKGIDLVDLSGYSVSSAGDVDGDGKDDVIIGAERASPDGASYAGESYLVYGAALAESGGVIDLGDLTSEQGVLIKGIDAYDYSGSSVSSAGDVDGDGKDDVIIGAYSADPDGANAAGESYLLYGDALASSDGTLDLATLTAEQGVLIKGIDASDYSGRSVSSAGDVDGDGTDDVLIGAYFASPEGAAYGGESYLLYGDALAASDGTLDLATLTPDQGVLIEGINPLGFSGYSVSSAGDVDNDGKDDVTIGAYRVNSGTGESYVLSGELLLEERTTGDGVIDLGDLFVV